MPDILRMFSYPFMARAFAAGVAVALASSLLGVSLVLKRYSMIGDGLSHVSFRLPCHSRGAKLVAPCRKPSRGDGVGLFAP